MDFSQLIRTFHDKMIHENFIQGTISQPRQKTDDLKRVRMKRIQLRDQFYIQFEYQYERILNHENILLEEIEPTLIRLLEQFRQIHAQFETEQIHVQISKKFKVMWKSKAETLEKEVDFSHNRKKNYLLDEDTVHPFLVRLGVQTEDGKIKKAYYDKFR